MQKISLETKFIKNVIQTNIFLAIIQIKTIIEVMFLVCIIYYRLCYN